MDYQSAKVAALMAGLEAKVAKEKQTNKNQGQPPQGGLGGGGTLSQEGTEYHDKNGGDANSPSMAYPGFETGGGNESAAGAWGIDQLPNNLNIYGNQASMNINPLILTNIQGSPYFKKDLFALKTFHEVIDEIYFKVDHLEPWERGSRKTSGQVGMCGGVRGVGAGGVASTAYCIMFKLYTMRLTKRQLLVLMNHADSPYIRGIGFLYIRYTQHPQDLFTWFEPYLDDQEEIDPKSGSGDPMTIGDMLRKMLRKLEWYATMFPRIPVKFAKEIDDKLKNYAKTNSAYNTTQDTYSNSQDGVQQSHDWAQPESSGDRHNEHERYKSNAETYDELMAKHLREQQHKQQQSGTTAAAGDEDKSTSSRREPAKKSVKRKRSSRSRSVDSCSSSSKHKKNKKTKSKSKDSTNKEKKESKTSSSRQRNRSRSNNSHRRRSRSKSGQSSRSKKEAGEKKYKEKDENDRKKKSRSRSKSRSERKREKRDILKKGKKKSNKKKTSDERDERRRSKSCDGRSKSKDEDKQHRDDKKGERREKRGNSSSPSRSRSKSKEGEKLEKKSKKNETSETCPSSISSLHKDNSNNHIPSSKIEQNVEKGELMETKKHGAAEKYEHHGKHVNKESSEVGCAMKKDIGENDEKKPKMRLVDYDNDVIDERASQSSPSPSSVIPPQT